MATTLMTIADQHLTTSAITDTMLVELFVKTKRSDNTRTQYIHSVRLHINIAKALCAFGVKLNYLCTNIFAVIKPDTFRSPEDYSQAYLDRRRSAQVN